MSDDLTRSDRLKGARIGAGFNSASEAARKLGLVESTYLSHENGSRGLTFESIDMYAKVFGSDPVWIAYGTGGAKIDSPRLVGEKIRVRYLKPDITVSISADEMVTMTLVEFNALLKRVK